MQSVNARRIAMADFPQAAPEVPDVRLSQISTNWTALFEAHAGPGDVAAAAQRRLLQRYHRAVYRYLLAAVRDPDAAEELFQEVALRFLRCDFRNAQPERGRFRDFLKRVLSNLIVDHRRKLSRQPAALPPDVPDAESVPPFAEDEEFLASWRKELMEHAWGGLAEEERRTGKPLYTMLRFRVDHPEARSAEIARHLSGQMGRALTPEWVRKWLLRAREAFTELLLSEVERSLGSPSREQLEQELLDLGLMEYCRPTLERRRQAPS
jgi:RNA polymerase sigma-70 factor (ECF subfamily)